MRNFHLKKMPDEGGPATLQSTLRTRACNELLVSVEKPTGNTEDAKHTHRNNPLTQKRHSPTCARTRHIYITQACIHTSQTQHTLHRHAYVHYKQHTQTRVHIHTQHTDTHPRPPFPKPGRRWAPAMPTGRREGRGVVPRHSLPPLAPSLHC